MNTTLIVRRGGGDKPVSEARFEVPFVAGQTLLDGLRWIRGNIDPTLAFRFSCINANACKECMMVIDGDVDYACTTRLHEGEMTVAPLPNKALIADLVTEIAPPDERLTPKAAKPAKVAKV
jgi:succinate dehydrogenase/fumarate reductase-like Fe-S protein